MTAEENVFTVKSFNSDADNELHVLPKSVPDVITLVRFMHNMFERNHLFS